ncbi:MAG: carbohydrate ABC transporter permease [Anaerolineae bacterium]|nr:carbohydrate ABC transporter permease [Anaerolineae bacterium]
MMTDKTEQTQVSFIQRLFSSSDPFRPAPGSMIISYIFLGLWSFVVLFPLYWVVVTAFKLPIDVNVGPRFLPYGDYEPSTHAWNYLLAESGNLVTRPYINTMTVAIWSSIFALIIGAAASYALNRFTYRPKIGLIMTFLACILLAILLIVVAKLHWIIAVVLALSIYFLLAFTIGRRFERSMGNDDIAFWIISQRMLPPVAVIIPIYVLFQRLGLLNTHAALIITYTAVNIPLVIWFMRDYFSGIPIELEESAFIDGANRYQTLIKIVLPLSVPGLVATFLIVLVFAWNEYVLALFLSGADTQTMPLLVAAQNATRGPQWWNISVLVMLMVAPIIILAIILERFIARGLLIGAVKG